MAHQKREVFCGFHSSGNSGKYIFMHIETRVKVDSKIFHPIGESERGICKPSTYTRRSGSRKMRFAESKRK